MAAFTIGLVLVYEYLKDIDKGMNLIFIFLLKFACMLFLQSSSESCYMYIVIVLNIETMFKRQDFVVLTSFK